MDNYVRISCSRRLYKAPVDPAVNGYLSLFIDGEVWHGGTERNDEWPHQGEQLPHNVTYDAGQVAILYCSVDGLGNRTVTWRKLPNRSPLTIGGVTWVKDGRLHAEHVASSGQWNLVIDHVTLQDAGTYECRVSARDQHFRHRVNLEVRVLPARRYPRIEISGRNAVKAGETIELQCNASMVDVTEDRLEWMKDGRPVLGQVGRDRLEVFRGLSLQTSAISSSLTIRHAAVSDSGFYVCRSTGRSQLAGVKLEVKPDSSNSKRADNLQHYTGKVSGQTRPTPHARALLVPVTVFVTSLCWSWAGG